MVWLIVILILLFLLFYPLAVSADMEYREENWKGKAVLHPFFAISRIKITLWDSNKPKKEKSPKNEEKKNKKKKKKKKESKNNKNEGKKGSQKIQNLLQQFKSQPLSETLAMAFDLLKTMKQGVKRLRVELEFGYALEDPATMGYLTGAAYAGIGAVYGDPRKTRWRIRLYPQWEAMETMGFLKGKITICFFDLIYAFGGVLIKVIKILIDKLRRK